jgi:threonyl-tRNA synthetase
MLLAQKFGMEYTGRNNTQEMPYILHRTSLGCYERTLALLLEKYAGALPMWMMPTQVKVLPIGDEHLEYANAFADKCREAGIRIEVDARNEKIGYKIREAQLQKIPYMLIIGEKEMAEGTVAVRSRKSGDLGSMPCEEFLQEALCEIRERRRYSK